MPAPDALMLIELALLFEKLEPVISALLALEATMPLVHKTMLLPTIRKLDPSATVMVVNIELNKVLNAATIAVEPVIDIAVFAGVLPLMGPPNTELRTMARILFIAIEVVLPIN